MVGNDTSNINQLLSQTHRSRQHREKSYRDRALKLFPWVCARCGREFSGKRLRELTVHHKDHNHDYNPPDGSNWELLCLYCHDNEHNRDMVADAYAHGQPDASADSDFMDKPFAGLAEMLKRKSAK